MSHIEFEWNSADLAVWRGGKVEFALQRAMRLAGNRAIRKAQSESVEHVTSKKWLRSEFVKSRMPLTFPKASTPIEGMEWTERVSGDPIEVSRYPHIQTPTGVSVRVNRGGGTTRIRHAFVAMNRRGHEGVFLREGRSRLPIRELRTSRIVDAMQDAGLVDGILEHARAEMQTAFARGLEREIGKLRAKGDA